MRLPPNRRADLLELIGATPLADLQLVELIDMLSSPSAGDGFGPFAPRAASDADSASLPRYTIN